MVSMTPTNERAARIIGLGILIAGVLVCGMLEMTRWLG